MNAQFFVKAMLCLCLSLISVRNLAQSLTVGDKVPDIPFERLLNAPSSSGKSSDYAGKIIVLDFWATWCIPCVKALPKMQALQDKYRDKLQIITVSDEEEKIITPFLQRRKDIRLPVAMKTELMQQLFPHRAIPHAIVIDASGVIQAITRSENIHEQVIENVLAGKKINLPVKKDIMGEVLLEGQPNNASTDNILIKSLLTKNLPGASCAFAEILSNEKPVGFRMVNYALHMMILNAMNLPNKYAYRMWLNNLSDSALFFQQFSDTATDVESWAINNTYCYELIAPEQNEQQQKAIMRNDMLQGLPWLRTKLEDRQVDCYVLMVNDRSRLKPSAYSVYQTGYSNPATTTEYLMGHSMNDFAEHLENVTNVPFVNESGVDGRYDIQFNYSLLDHKKKFKGLGDFNKAVAPLGIKLKIEKRMINGIGVYVNRSVSNPDK